MSLSLKDELFDLIENYNPDELERVKKAYDMANSSHAGAFRESGEAYIMHPLNVCMILAELMADGATLCAALLHDTLEDTNLSEYEIREEFGEEVLTLVQGVTKLTKKNFLTKDEYELANTRRLIEYGLKKDPRIILIKLADRLHNMRTLGYKKPEKQKENAVETLELFVPLAENFGVYRIKHELEDLSAYYYWNSEYMKVDEERKEFIEKTKDEMNSTEYRIHDALCRGGIESNSIIQRVCNCYGIMKKERIGIPIDKIHDLLRLKIVVPSREACYVALGAVHAVFRPDNNGRFRDYIACPKDNNYMSLLSTIKGANGSLIETQIRSEEMDLIDSFGYSAFWKLKQGSARYLIPDRIKQSNFFESFDKIFANAPDDKVFVQALKDEVLCDKMTIYDPYDRGVILPCGSTALDFSYAYDENNAVNSSGCCINNSVRTLNTVLYDGDVVDMFYNPNVVPDAKQLTYVKTSTARMGINRNLRGQ